MVAALYGTGLRPGDRFFCPSSPAWGHGLWHGTLAPLALGLTIGAYAGKFDADAAAAGAGGASLHQHLRRGDALPHDARLGRARRSTATSSTRLSFTGEPIDSETAAFCRGDLRPAGVQHVRHHRDRRDPGELSGRRRISRVKPGSLGKPMPGGKVEVHDADGKPCPPGVIGEMKVLAARRLDRHQGPRPHRRGRLLLPWRPRRRRHHLGRLDDERGRDRGRGAEASRRARGRARSACPTRCAARW